jgi:hypothetical protein
MCRVRFLSGSIVMKRYRVKSQTGKTEYIEIIGEIEDGYLIRLTRLFEGNERISEEIMTRHLFNICLKTGYIYETPEEAGSVA